MGEERWRFLGDLFASGPRENGSTELADTASRLAAHLESIGGEVALLPFTAHPYSLRITGIIIFAIGVLYCLTMRSGKPLLALLVALIGPALVIVEQDYQVPIFGWPGSAVEHNVSARFGPENPQRRLILSAHYDTKTDLLDHIQRMPLDILALPLVALLLIAAVGALRNPIGNRLTRAAPWLAALFGFAALLVYTGGGLLSQRSHGALDDGAACAMLAMLAEDLAQPDSLRNSEVEIVFFAAEEIGRQGSQHFVHGRFDRAPDVPTFAVNFDPLGASNVLAIVAKEGGAVRSFRPDEKLIDQVEAVYRATHERELYRTPTGGYTDAVAFLARGIPAVTLFSRVAGWSIIPRGMHSSADRADRIDREALHATLAFVRRFVAHFDSQSWP